MGTARKPSLDPWGCASYCPHNILLYDWLIAPAGLFRQCSRYYTGTLHVERCPKRKSCKLFFLYSSLTDLYPIQGAFPRSGGLSSSLTGAGQSRYHHQQPTLVCTLGWATIPPARYLKGFWCFSGGCPSVLENKDL